MTRFSTVSGITGHRWRLQRTARFGPNANAMPAFPAAVNARFRVNAANRTFFVLDKSDIMVYIY
jgi:hypothetical protein